MRIEKIGDEYVATWKDIKGVGLTRAMAMTWCFWGIKAHLAKQLKANQKV